MNTDFFLDAPSPFVLLDAARAMDSPPGLTAWRRCEGVPFWQVLEAAAQAAALQQRVARDFSCHAFLLSVERAPWPAGPLSGTAAVAPGTRPTAPEDRGTASSPASLPCAFPVSSLPRQGAMTGRAPPLPKPCREAPQSLAQRRFAGYDHMTYFMVFSVIAFCRPF